jgi:hypothetical protein
LRNLEAASVVRQAAKSAQEVLKPALSNNPAVAARQQAAIDETELLRQLNPLSTFSLRARHPRDGD